MPTPAEIATPGYDPYSDVAGDVGWFGSDIVKSVKKAATSVAKVANKIGQNPIVKTAVGAARTALKNAGPIGMAANGAISAMDAGLSGANIGNIGLAAIKGAAPSGIDTALNAGINIAKGKNIAGTVLDAAIKTGANSFAPGSGERFAYSVAVDAIKKGASKADLGNARRAMVNEGQKRAFDAAVGVVATHAPKIMPMLPKGRPMRPLSVKTSRPTKLSKAVLNPRTGGSQRPTLTVVSHAIPKNRIVRWRSLSGRAAKFILNRVPHAPRFALLGNDTGALTPDGKIYIVEAGDFPGKIAQKLTGSSSRYLELLAANPQKPTVTVNGVKNFKTLFAGERLNVPTSWQNAAPTPVITTTQSPIPASTTTVSGVRKYTVLPGDFAGKIAQKFTGVASRYVELINANPQKPTVKSSSGVINFKSLFAGEKLNIPASWPDISSGLPSTAPPVVISTTPVISPTAPDNNAVDTAAIIQAKSILVAFSKTDGVSENGNLGDYGTKPEDMSTSFGVRDKTELIVFCRFNNKTFGTQLNVSGDLTPPVANALREWAEKKAVSIPSVPVTAMPSTPVQSPGLPAVIASPQPGTAIVPASLPASLPTITPISTTPASTPASEAPKSDGNALVLAGAGAGLGWLMGGPLGALIGGAAGAFAGQK